MPDDIHKIERFVYDVSFDSETHAYDFQANVSSFIQNEMLGVIDEVCNELDKQGEVICIEKLELDLGAVKHENEIRARFKDELYKSLREKIVEVEQNPSENEKIISRDQSEFYQFIHFLQTGNFPWNRRNGNNNSIEQILLNLLKDNSEELIAWLKRFTKNDYVRKRIINQFQDKQILAIVNKVLPAHSQFISDYVSDLRQTHEKEPAVNVTNTEFRELTWDVILAYVLNDRGSRFNKKSFIGYTLQKIAVSQNISYEMLLKDFSSSIEKLSKKFSFKTEFTDIITELSVEQGDSSEDKSEIDTEKYSHKEKDLIQLQAALDGTQKDLSELNIQILMEKHPENILDLLEKYVKNNTLKKRFTDVFTEDQIKLIIKTIRPEQNSFIVQLSNELDKNYDSHKLDQSKTHFKKVKWQVIIVALFEDRGSIFNRKEFVKSVIRQLAAHYNISIKELTLIFSNILEVSQLTSEMGVLKEVVIELKDDLHIEDQKREIPDSEIQQYIIACELYDELIYYLYHGYFKGDIKKIYNLDKASSLLSQLEKKSQSLAFKFYRDIQKPEYIKLLVENTTEEFIQSVIELIMKKSYSSDADKIKTFVKTTKWNAATVLDKSEFYARFLHLLISKQEINFKQLIREINELCFKIIEKDNLHPFGYFTVKSHFLSILNEEKSLSAYNKTYEETCLYLIEHYKSRINEILQTIISDEWVFKSFLNKTTDYLLMLIVENTTHTLFAYGFIQYLSGVLGFNKQQQLSSLRINFWTIVFRALQSQNYKNGKDIEIRILEIILLNLKDTQEKKKVISKLKNKVDSFNSIEKKQILNIIKKTEERLQISKTDISKGISKEEQFEQQAISLLKGNSVEGIQYSILFETILKLIKEKPNIMFDLLQKYLYQKNVRHFWIKQFPDTILRRMLFLLSPQGFMHIYAVSEILWNTCTLLCQNQKYSIKTFGKWHYIFETLVNRKQSIDPGKFTSAFIMQFLLDIDKYREKEFLSDLCEKIESDAKSVHDKISLEVVHTLKKIGQNLNAGEQKDDKRQTESESTTLDTSENNIKESIYIKNAGLVIAAPYYTELFKRLDLIEANRFKDRHAAERAVHLLQYMLDESTSSPEFMLLLNKILCGIKTGVPIQREIDITEKERETILQLIEGMIQNWKVIKNSSVEGFRESFLQRDGVLHLKDDCWQLLVESKAYDMLIDQIPWSFTTIKYPWMDKVLYVKWR